MIRPSLLRSNLGVFRSLMLVFVCAAMWVIAVAQFASGAGWTLIAWWSAGLLFTLAMLRPIAGHGETYQGLMGCVGVIMIGSVILLQLVPIVVRDRWSWMFLIVASFYCHSAIWYYGSNQQSATLDAVNQSDDPFDH